MANTKAKNTIVEDIPEQQQESSDEGQPSTPPQNTTTFFVGDLDDDGGSTQDYESDWTLQESIFNFHHLGFFFRMLSIYLVVGFIFRVACFGLCLCFCIRVVIPSRKEAVVSLNDRFGKGFALPVGLKVNFPSLSGALRGVPAA